MVVYTDSGHYRNNIIPKIWSAYPQHFPGWLHFFSRSSLVNSSDESLRRGHFSDQFCYKLGLREKFLRLILRSLSSSTSPVCPPNHTMKTFCAHAEFSISSNRDVKDKKKMTFTRNPTDLVCPRNFVVPLEAVTSRKALRTPTPLIALAAILPHTRDPRHSLLVQKYSVFSIQFSINVNGRYGPF